MPTLTVTSPILSHPLSNGSVFLWIISKRKEKQRKSKNKKEIIRHIYDISIQFRLGREDTLEKEKQRK